MTSWTSISLFVAAILLAAPFVTPIRAGELTGSRPNILFVLTDDQGYGDLASHGHPFVKTPNLDRLRDQSTRFTDFHTSPTCSPARAGLMSGLAPFKVGVTHTIFERERMAPGVPTVADVLKEAGYATGIFGKWHLGDDTPYQPGSRGFDEVFIHGGGGIGQGWDAPGNTYFDPIIRHNGTFVKTSGFCTDVFFAEATRWMKQCHRTDKPFFAYLSLNAPHGPFHAPEDYLKQYDNGKDSGFFGMITNIDDNMGTLMGRLEEWGMAEDTLVIFMTDNGSVKSRYFNAGMTGGKNNPHEGGSRVPSFLCWPGRLNAGADIDGLTRHYDLMPTLAELAGADISAIELDGRSLVPLLENPDAAWPDRTTFFHKGRWGHPDAKQEKHRRYPSPEMGKYINFAVRTERWRLVGKNEKKLELYDVQADPGETTDVAEQHPETVKDLMARYEAWWDEVRPRMINDGRDLDGVLHFREAFKKQEQAIGIPDWQPPEF